MTFNHIKLTHAWLFEAEHLLLYPKNWTFSTILVFKTKNCSNLTITALDKHAERVPSWNKDFRTF